MISQKYEMTGEEKEFRGHIVHRIRASRDFGNVKAGDLGGWIESERNLSHTGTCWVADEAIVYGNARVFDNAQVYGWAKVFGNAWICDRAKVHGWAEVFGDAKICGMVRATGEAKVCGNVRIYTSVVICGRAFVNKQGRFTEGEVISSYIDLRYTSSFPPEALKPSPIVFCYGPRFKEIRSLENYYPDDYLVRDYDLDYPYSSD